jgi:hypothetical protein
MEKANPRDSYIHEKQMFLGIHGFDQARETVLRQEGIGRQNGSAFYNRGALKQKEIRIIIDQNGNFHSFQFS